jgi:hypothetical protein
MRAKIGFIVGRNVSARWHDFIYSLKFLCGEFDVEGL